MKAKVITGKNNKERGKGGDGDHDDELNEWNEEIKNRGERCGKRRM